MPDADNGSKRTDTERNGNKIGEAHSYFMIERGEIVTKFMHAEKTKQKGSKKSATPEIAACGEISRKEWRGKSHKCRSRACNTYKSEDEKPYMLKYSFNIRLVRLVFWYGLIRDF